MSKVTPDNFRKTKTFNLPESGIEVTCYASILVGEITDVTKKEVTLENNIGIVAKVIKSWNMYLKESDDNSAEITVENLSLLPATDFEYLVEEMKKFSDEVKKK